MKRIIFVMAFFASLALFSSPVQAGQAKDVKEWTFLLFLNGHNNLDSFGAMNINQMEEVGSNENLNMVVQWASIRNKQTKRLYVTQDNDPKVVKSQVVQTLAPVDMGDYKNLVEFVRWGAENYPAKKYMIAVWNHGNGWEFKTRSAFEAKDISYDDTTGHHITTEQLGLAMNEAAQIIGHKVDVYGSDACLMAMAEVAAEMKDSVEMFVGSQEVEPGQGWPYSTWMRRWASNPTATAAEVSTYLTEEFTKSYDGGIYGHSDVTFSAMDLTQFPAFFSALKDLNASLANLSPSDMRATKSLADATQEFYLSDYKDIFDFVDRLQSSKVGIQSSILSNLKDAVQKMVISVESTDSYANSHGISVWLPTDVGTLNRHKTRYSNLELNKQTKWLDFLTLVNR